MDRHPISPARIAFQGWKDNLSALREMPAIFCLTIFAVSAASNALTVILPLDGAGKVHDDVVALVYGVIIWTLSVPLLVGINRYVLLGEKKGITAFRAGRRIWKFWLLYVMVGSLFALPGIILSLIKIWFPAIVGLATLSFFALWIAVACAVGAPSFLLLPAIAVDASGKTWRKTVSDIKGCRWRVLITVFLGWLPLLLIVVVASIVEIENPKIVGNYTTSSLRPILDGCSLLAAGAVAAITARLYQARGYQLTGQS